MSNRLRVWVIISCVALLGPLALAAQLSSAAPALVTYGVQITDDEPDFNPGDGFCVSTPSGFCTLRAAVMEANRVLNQDVTIMLPAGIYTITIPPSGSNGDDTGEFNLHSPNVNSPLITIQGAGAATTILDGNGIDRLFAIHPGRRASLNDITLRDGCCGVPTSVGGGLYIIAGGSVTLTGVTISGNPSESGGGIYNAGTATLLNTTLDANGGIFNGGINGGGIYNAGTLNLTNVTLSGNAASNGGGVYNASGTANLRNVTLNGNSAYNGGGIFTGLGSTTNLTNVTLSGNTAVTYLTGGGKGGGIDNGGALNLTNVTLSGNKANIGLSGQGGLGGGIYRPAGAVTLRNTLFAKGVTGANCADFAGGVFSLSDDNSCGFGAGRDDVANLHLGLLANNGGFTQTHLPGAGSAARDNGTNSGCPATDQRGLKRPMGPACDVGAVEAPLWLFLPLIVR